MSDIENESSQDDDECFYQMDDDKIRREPSTEPMNNEPATPADDLDENFYEIQDETPEHHLQAYIDEPLTPSDQINPNFHYTVLTGPEFNDLMMKHVNEVKDILELSSTIVRLLLNYYKWNKQRLLEQFYEMDHEEFFAQAKLVDPFAPHPQVGEPSEFCLICYSDEDKQMYHLRCEHRFCTDCWKSYITNQIVHEGVAQKIPCPDSECQLLVDEETVHRFLHDDSFARNIYEKLLLNDCVDHNPRARWCPGKSCGHIIHASSLTSAYNYAQLIQCRVCHSSFCFQCGQPWHDPIKCHWLLQWNKKLFDDSQNVVWIKANTKVCPKCHVNIEKNGGCNHMTCRSCHYEFCWLCFGDWAKHNQCNRFNEAERFDQMQNQYSKLLARYMHYYDRFRNHEHSLELETKHYKNISSNIKRPMQEISKMDVQTIEKSFNVLLKCRQTLIYTYPFAYYLKENNQSIVFEKNQEDLERACEALSELLEQDVTKETVMLKIKKDLEEKSRYCDARKDVLLKHAKEGYVNNYWLYDTTDLPQGL